MKLEFTNTCIFDSKKKEWKPIDSIVIKDSLIKQIKFSSNIGACSTFIIPGLIDSHIHIAEESDFNKLESFSLSEDLNCTINRVNKNLKIALSKGITGMIDFGFYRNSSLLIKEYIKTNANRLNYPHFFTSGGMLTKKNGHAPERGIIVNKDTLESTVNTIIEEKADVIKILNDPIVFAKEEVRLVTSIAHKNNLKVSMHLYTEDAAILALDCNIDCIQHAGYFTDSTLERMAKTGVIVVPTFIAALDTIINPTLTLPKDHFSDITLDICKKWFQEECNIIGKLHSFGVNLACGTDACFPGTPPDSLIREMIAWDYFDIPIPDILQSATYNAAMSVNKEHFIGQIKEGLSADFIIYKSNPEHNINILKSPQEIWLKGTQIFASNGN